MKIKKECKYWIHKMSCAIKQNVNNADQRKLINRIYYF